MDGWMDGRTVLSRWRIERTYGVMLYDSRNVSYYEQH